MDSMIFRRILLLAFCSFLVFICVGCNTRPDTSGVEVVIEGGGRFPQMLAGTWRADRGGWEIVFEPDGAISSAVVGLGRVRLKPGQTAETRMVLGGLGFFEPGRWTVQYSHRKRELGVEITIERFRVELGDDIVRGSTRDIFIGAVSPDGRLWWADRYNFPAYIVDTEKYPNYKLPFDPNDSPRDSFVFQKVTDPQ
jgi:hypothetical protein